MLSLNEVFNENYYLETNPEAAEAVASGEFASAEEHFTAVGIDEGLRFSPLIDLGYYQTAANPDLSDLSSREALDHLLETGIEEGRIFSAFVDLEFYLEANPDLGELSYSEALLNLQNVGIEEGRQFESFVDLEEYRASNEELAELSLSETFAHLTTFFAPDDEGQFRFALGEGFVSIPDEVDIVTPEILQGSGEANFQYSRSENQVTLEVDVEGLPYQLDLTRPEDVTTDSFNQVPLSVEDGKWQVWLIGNWFTVESNFWYDGTTGEIIGNEHDLFEFDELPTDDTPLDVNGDGVDDTVASLPVAHLIGSPTVEGNPDGTGNFVVEYDYDQILDERGTAGVYAGVIPYNLNQPDEVGIYYTQGGLPNELALTWDDVLNSIRTDPGINVSLSLEPDPKPEFLDSRDNTMIAFGTFYPLRAPEGVVYEPVPNTFRFAEAEDFVTHVNEPWPARQAIIEAESELVFGSQDDDVLDAANPTDEFDGNYDGVLAGAGDDLIDASQATTGENIIFSGTGSDEILTGASDRAFGGTGADILDASAGTGSNRLYGSGDNDELLAGTGDRLFGGYGDDVLNSSVGGGDNRLYGEAGNDIFLAGSSDRFLGGDGDDAFFVTEGADNYFTGGAGADAFWIINSQLPPRVNTITDFDLSEDVIGVGGVGATSVDDLVFSQAGDNTIIAYSGLEIAEILNIQASNLEANGVFAFA